MANSASRVPFTGKMLRSGSRDCVGKENREDSHEQMVSRRTSSPFVFG